MWKTCPAGALSGCLVLRKTGKRVSRTCLGTKMLHHAVWIPSPRRRLPERNIQFSRCCFRRWQRLPALTPVQPLQKIRKSLRVMIPHRLFWPWSVWEGPTISRAFFPCGNRRRRPSPRGFEWSSPQFCARDHLKFSL